MDQYEKQEKLGEGAHGVVIKARVRTREEIAAQRRQARQHEQLEAVQAEKAAASLQNTPRKRKLEQDANAAAAAADAADEALDDIVLPAPENTSVPQAQHPSSLHIEALCPFH